MLPLRDIVVFPHIIAPLFVGRKKSILALEEVIRSDTFILLTISLGLLKRWAVFQERCGTSDEHAIADLICDLGHLAEERGLDFLSEVKRGIGHWYAEHPFLIATISDRMLRSRSPLRRGSLYADTTRRLSWHP